MSTTNNGIDLNQVIHRLIEEKKRLDLVISFLEKIEVEGASSVKAVKEAVPKRRGRRFMSSEERRAVSERMRKYWRQRRASQNSGEPVSQPANPMSKSQVDAGSTVSPGKRGRGDAKTAAPPR